MAQSGDSIVLDNSAAPRCVFKPAGQQSSDYYLHHAGFHLIPIKSLPIRSARGHQDPKKLHSLQGYQDRIGNQMADDAA